LLHLKDLKKGNKGDLLRGTFTENDVALGADQLDIPAILKVAKKQVFSIIIILKVKVFLILNNCLKRLLI
jgi:hypothetical protein